MVVKTRFLKLVFIAPHFLQFFFLRFNLLLIFKITEKKKQNVINFFLIKLLLLFRELSSPVYNKLKIFGIGFSINVCDNHIIFQVGTTNILSYKIPQNVFVTVLGKKSTILLVCGTNVNYINNFCYQLIQLRYPNIYTGKGVFFYKKKFIKKIGKVQKK